MDHVVENRPRSRGVTQLMYVGDDEAVENATKSKAELWWEFLNTTPGGRKVRNVAAVAALVALFGPRTLRTPALVVGGVAAASPFFAV